ncbi:MAG TPA: hypothetical protein VG318_12500, partial [Actinomycetota bacterium]|nr:hypothetical protein [Actinomycetota bacterium]
YTFVLDEEHKGELGDPGDTVEVHAPLSGASCGLETAPGEQYGIYLYVRDRDGVWASNLCSQVSPETLREGASPLPAPTSDGPVRMIAGGSFGDTQTMLLDAQGRTVGYGEGDLDVTHVDGCRGNARLLEVGRDYPARPVLFVRDVDSLDVVRTVELPIARRGGLHVVELHCMSPDGGTAAVFVTNSGEPEARGVVFLVRGDDVERAYEGTARAATFRDGYAYLQEGRWGRRLRQVTLDAGTAAYVTRLPGRFSTELALSPDGTRLAGIAYPRWEKMDEKPSRIYTVDVRSGRVRLRSLGTGERDADVLWLSDSRLVMFVSYPDRSRVLDLRLRTRGRFARWEPNVTAIVDGTAYGADHSGRLWEVDLPGGSPSVSRELPSPIVYDLEAMP